MVKETFVFEDVQRSMVERGFNGWGDVYRVCRCGYIEENIPRDSDHHHDELCDERPSWQWAPLRYTELTGALTEFLKDLVHYYYVDSSQSSLRCSYCAHAPNDTIHATCKATWDSFYEIEDLDGSPHMNQSRTKCYELANSSIDPYCRYHSDAEVPRS